MDGSSVLPRAGSGAVASPARRRVVLAALCLGILVAQVDTSVANLAMEPIRRALAVPVAALQWILDAYNLTYAVLLLTGGLLADRYGRRRCFAAGAAIMALASIACGLAPDAGVLIAARVAAGVGAALLLPASLAIIRVAWVEPQARRQALGVWASCNGLAFVIGPGLGGVFIAHWGWRSVFFLAVPIALGALLLTPAIRPSRDTLGRAFDAPGQALGALALAALVYAAIPGAGAAVHGAAFAVSLAAFALFLRREAGQGDAALVPLNLFASRGFAGVLAATGAMTFGIYGLIFLLLLDWMAHGVFSALGAGFALMPSAGAFFVVSQFSAALSRRLGSRAVTAGGVAVIACGLAVVAATANGTPLALAELGLVLAGVGMGIATGPLMAASVEAAPAERSGTASSLFNVARMVGATLGVAALGTLYGMAGLSVTMLAGSLVQFAGAAFAWRAQA